MRNPWDDTPMDKLLKVVLKVFEFVLWGSILAIPIIVAFALVHFLAKYW